MCKNPQVAGNRKQNMSVCLYITSHLGYGVIHSFWKGCYDHKEVIPSSINWGLLPVGHRSTSTSTSSSPVSLPMTWWSSSMTVLVGVSVATGEGPASLRSSGRLRNQVNTQPTCTLMEDSTGSLKSAIKGVTSRHQVWVWLAITSCLKIHIFLCFSDITSGSVHCR